AMLRYLPGAGCDVTAYTWPRLGGGAFEDISVGQPMPQSFEAASLRDLLTPRAHRVHMPADIYHATDYRIVRMDCPQVATLHDALPISHPEWCRPGMRGIKNWLQRKAAHKADHVIAMSHFAIDELVSCFGIDPDRISVVPNGVDDAWLQAPEPDAVAATLRDNGLRAGYFLFVGTLQPRKNVERLLAAYLQLPAAVRAERQLVIVGAAGWLCSELVRRMAAASENGEQVVWLHSLTSGAALRHVYAGAGVFAFPSLYEGFGIPVAEAFAAGVPVVASNTSSLPEVSQGAALEVDPLDAGAIGAAMLALVRDDALRARCIAAGRVRAGELTWRESARRTAAVYHSLLSSQ
ncbi:MAG: glycosyltransferase, partial [Massilia sp.]|nr:glycosyltransferase [Massilia sp.]